MWRKTSFVIGLALLASLVLIGAAFAQTGDPAKGKTTWEQKNCKSCHGPNGEGKYAPPRAGDGKSVADWIKQVRTPRADMPAYTTTQIADQDIADMNAYMQTLPAPTAFTLLKTDTVASDPPGRLLTIDKRCVACHGNFEGFVKTRFVDKARSVTADAVLKQLRTPAANMPMFNATQVTDAQANQIAAFLQAVEQKVIAAAPAATATAVKPATLPTTGAPLLPAALGLAAAGAGLLGLGLRARRRG